MDVFGEMARRDFEQVVCGRDPRTGIGSVIAVHDTSLGPALGGVRMRHYPDHDAAVADAIDLAEAMTYKAAVAGLTLGGGKSVINADPRRDKTEALLESHARLVAALGGRYIPAVDMGTDSDDLAVMGRHIKVSCNTQNPSWHTARGVFRAIEATAKVMNTSLMGLRLGVQGLGHVGAPLAAMLAEAGASLDVADLDDARVERARRAHGATAVAVDEIVTRDLDVLVPAAAGGVIDEAVVAHLRVRAVVPAANNALATDSLAAALDERGIVYVPDFVANAGGLMACEAEVNGATDQLAERVDGIAHTIAELLNDAASRRTTPLHAALDLARTRLENARDRRPWTP